MTQCAERQDKLNSTGLANDPLDRFDGKRAANGAKCEVCDTCRARVQHTARSEACDDEICLMRRRKRDLEEEAIGADSENASNGYEGEKAYLLEYPSTQDASVAHTKGPPEG
ncbi:hypothetical protein ACEPAI_418 [Sanghuangporus weigelae]